MGNQIFISYRRTGGDTTAKLICETLKNRGFTVFYDFDTLKGGFFDTRIIGAIEGCNDMVLVLPPHALDRCANEGDWVRQEIRHALQHGKNIIPVFLDGFSFPTDLPDDIAEVTRFNGLHFSMEYFDAAIDKITEKLSPQTKAGRSLTLRPSNLRDLVRNVCSFGSCDFNSTSPSDAYYSERIDRTRYNVIYFKMSTAPIRDRARITSRMKIYDDRNNVVCDNAADYDWRPEYNQLTLSWIVRAQDGSFVRSGQYRAIFQIDGSREYEYAFEIVSGDTGLVSGGTPAVLTEDQKSAKRKPILLILIQDEPDHNLSKALVDIDIISRLSSEEKSRFGQLISSHAQKQRRVLDDSIRRALMQRNYVTPFEDVVPNRLAMMELQLFEAAYPKVLPFPFDGYATPRGNAAKDCAEFTRRLISSSLSYSDTQTMSVAQRNRAQTVLNASWKVFSKRDGSVVQKPGNVVVKAIMADWEKKLSLQDGLNCADAIKIACAAPYGANLASAGLLWGVFIQAFQKVVQAQCEDAPVSLENIANSAFSGNSLDFGYLKGVTLYRMTGENGAWDQLLSDWASCGTYREQAEFADRIESLESSLPIPPALRPQIALCKSESKKAFDIIDAAEEKESGFIQRIEDGQKSDKLSLIAYGASLLQSFAKELRKDPMWDIARDIEPLVATVNEAKTKITAMFPAWLARNQPRGSTHQDLADFKRDSEERMARNLKNLELYDEKDKLLAQVDRVCKSFEQIVQAREAVAKYDAWEVQNGNVPDQTPFLRRDAVSKDAEKWVSLIRACAATMKRVGNQHYFDELASRLVRIEGIKKRIKEVGNAINDRAKAVLNSTLTIETASDIRDEVLDLTALYQGDDVNLEEFRVARNFLNAFIDAAARIDSLQNTQSQFDVLVAETKDDMVARFADEEPPWDIEESVGRLVKTVSQKRRKASSEWIAQIKDRYSGVDSMSLQEAENALREIKNPPPYFDDEKDKAACDVLIRKLEKHLESKGVDWLVEKFNQLTPAGQKLFLKQIRT